MSRQPAPLLDLNVSHTLGFFADLLTEADVADRDVILGACREAVLGTQPTILTALEQAWYRSLEYGDPAYNLYGTKAYLAEAFHCWWGYTREHLRWLRRPASLPPVGIAAHHANARLIVDLGNGIGFTTAALTLLFPKARVVATNVAGSWQYRIAELLAARYGFEMVPGPMDVEGQADLVFATEYFEHFYEPLEHLRTVVNCLDPAALVIANTFTGDATGHFNSYKVDGKVEDCRTVGRLFGQDLRSHGYSKVASGFNGKPGYWVGS